MRNDDDRKWLYDTMQSKGVDTGNYDEFCKSLNNKEDRDWYYQKSLEFGLNVGTDKDFTDMMADNTNSPSNGFDNPLKKLRQFAERVGVPNGQSVPTNQAVPTGLPESAQQNDVAQSVSQPVEMPENPNEAYIRASKNTALEKGNNIQQVPSVDYGELSRRAKNDFIDYFYGKKKMGAVGRTENTPNGVRTPYGAVLYDLKAAGEDESTARAIATEALGNFFDKASEQLGTAIINAIPKQSMDREGELNQLWYSRDVQNYIKDLCEKNGVEYDAVVRQKIQPAIRNAYRQKYGVDTNFNAFSGADRAEDQVRTYEANKVVAPYLGKMVDDAFAVFDKKGAEAYRKTRSENEESSMFVNPEQQGGHILAGVFGAERAKIKASDPGKVREHLEQRVEQLYGDLVKNKNFQKDAIAKAEELGIPVMEYIQSYVLPGFADNLQKKFRETAVAREMPDSDLENILQGITRDSIFGMLFNKLLYSDEQREYQQEAMAKSDRGMWSNVGRMTAGMAADFWLWLASGGIGAKAAQGIIKQRVASVAAKEGISEAAARVVVENEMKKFWTKNMIKNITPRLASSAVTLGGAEATTTAIRGITNEDNVIDVIADTAASAASGGTTGLAFGATGGMVHPLVGRLTGIPKLFGIIGGYEVEAGTMYAIGEIHKLLAGEAAFENPLEGMLESNISLGGIKLAQPHGVAKAWNSIRHPIRTTREAMQPSKEGYFTEDDIKSLESKTDSRNLLEVVKKLGSGEAVAREDVAEAATAYDTYMRDKDEPVSRKAKVANLFGKKAPVVGYEVSMEHFFDEDGNYIVRTRDMDGQCVNEYKFKNVEDGEAKETELKNTLYNNEVEALAERVNLWNGQRDLLSWQPQDEEMQRKVLTLNQHAEELVSIAEKQSSNEPLTPDEQKLLNTYWDALAGYVRDGGAYKTFERNYEKQKGLQEGTLEKILKKPSKDYSADERMVVDEYKEALRSELPERKGEDVEDVAVVQQQTERGQTERGQTEREQAEREQAERGQEEQELTVENERQVLIDEGRRALLSADSEALRQIDMDVDLAAERVRRLQEQEHPDAEALAAAQEMLSLAEARAYGVRTGMQEMIETQQRAIVEELEPMKSESGMITPVTLHDGRKGFVKAGAIDLDNHYGSLFVTFEKDGEWTTEQVGNNLIREVGESRSFDDMVSERSRAMEEETIARIQRISEGLDVEPGRQVMLTIGDVTAPFEVRGESNGQVVLRDANGEEVAMPRADVDNYIKATRAKEVAERLNIENPTEGEPTKTENPTPTLPEGEGVKNSSDRPDDGGEPPVAGSLQVDMDRLKEMSLDAVRKGEDVETLLNSPGISEEMKEEVRRYLSEASNDGKGGYDKQGNQLNSDGSLHIENITSLDDLTDADFNNPTRSVSLPDVPSNIRNAIGADKKPIVIKKNIFERNGISHSDLTPEQSREILRSVLYRPDLYGQAQKVSRPYNWVVLNTKGEDGNNRLVLLEVNNNKNNVEVVHWHYIRDKALRTLKRQAQREGGHILILPSESTEEAGGLSSLTLGLPSESKDNVNLSSVQENGEKIVENPQNISTEEVSSSSKTAADIFDEIREGYEREKQERLGYINAAKSSNERLRRAEKVYGSDSLTDGIIGDMEPRDAHELAASELRPHSIEWTSLKKELGAMRGGFGRNSDMGPFSYYIGKKDDMPLIGVPSRVRSFGDIVHEIWESRPDHLRDMSDQDVRNALLDVLMSAQKPSDIAQYILNNRIREAESALEGIYRSEENAAYEGFIEEFHETPEDYRNFLEVEATKFSHLTDVDIKEIYSIFAEKFLEDEQRKIGSLSSVDRNTEWRKADGSNRRSEEELRSQDSEGSNQQDYTGSEGNRQESSNKPGVSASKNNVPLEVERGTSGGEVEVRSGSFADRLSSAIAETETNPSEGQKKSGNYKKGHLSFGGYDFTIENPKGSVRRGVDATGKSWEQTMNNTYGYLRGKGMLGKDGDHLDVFINDGVDLDTFEGPIFIIDQVNKDGSFDEHKIMYGFDDMPSAIRNYLMNYERPWEGLGNITEVDKATFDKWLESSDRKLKPFAETRFGDSRDVVSKVMDEITKRQESSRETWKSSELEAMSDTELSSLIERREHQKQMNTDLSNRLADKKGYELARSNAQIDADIAQLRGEQERRKAALKEYDEYFGQSEVDDVRFTNEKVGERRPLTEREVVMRDALIDDMKEHRVDIIADEASEKLVDEVNGGANIRLMAAKKNIERGIDALQEIANGAESVPNAMTRDDISQYGGDNNITFYYGAIGNPERDFKGGYGIAHIGGKHGANTIIRILNVIATGKIDRYVKGNKTIILTDGEYEAVLALTRFGNKETWLFNGWKKNEKTDATGEVSTHSDATQANPTFSREDLGAVLSEAKLRKDAETAIKNDEKIKQHKVYHGSGADFDAFDHSHMGEGEGAQAYGYGTYVTEVEGIGKTYAESNGNRDLKKALNRLSLCQYAVEEPEKIISDIEKCKNLIERYSENLNHLEAERAVLLEKEGEQSEGYRMWKFLNGEALSEFPVQIKHYKNKLSDLQENLKKIEPEIPRLKAEYENALKEVERLKKETQRILYTVEIPDEVEAIYLDYTNRMGEQKDVLDSVDNALAADGWRRQEIDERIKFTNGDKQIILTPNQSGADLYAELKDAFGSAEQASKFLHDVVGVTGIKYPAEHMSGGRKDGAKNYVIFDESDLTITDKLRFFRTPNGEAYGFTLNGVIHIDPRIATSETPIHEYSHLWVDAMRKSNPEEWESIKKMLRAERAGKLGEIWRQVSENYPELEGNDDALCEEILTHYSGKRGAERLEAEVRRVADSDASPLEKSTVIAGLRRLGEGIRRFWKWVADSFHIHYKDVDEVADRIMSDLEEGRNFKEGDVTPEMEGQPMFAKKARRVEDEKTLMGVHNISEEKLKKALKTGGLANPSLAVIDTKQGMHNDYGAISLIPKSTLIDKRTGRNAGTYSGDAWTPTYPHVERRLTAEGEKHLEELSKAAGGGNKEIENHIWSNLISYIEDNSDRLHFLFLQQKGLNPEIKQQQITHSHEEYEELRKLLGDDFRNIRDLTKEQNDALLEIMMKPFEEESKASVADIQEAEKREHTYNVLLKMYREKLVDENGKLFFAKWNTYLDDVARDEYRRNHPQIDLRDTDYDASKRVNEEGLSEEYAQWKETLLNDNDISEVLFAGFTPSGTRKYLPNTAENASRLMNKQSDTNSYSNGGFGATRSQLLQKFSSLKDIRKNKDLIQNDETAAERAKELSDELFDIISQISDLQKISDNQFMNTDYAESRLQEAITKKDPVDYLNKEYGYHIPQDGELASQIKDFIEATQKLPAKYFETKFKRPVGLDEFAIAVVPENTSQEVVKALKDAGLDVRTYDASDYQTADENRRQVTMDAVNGRDDIRFRRGDRWNNSGYDEREDGTKASVRAIDAEREGTFTEGTFRKQYGLSKTAFNLFRDLGFIKNTEWHHTGKSFKKNDFFSWNDSNRSSGDYSYMDAQVEKGSLGYNFNEHKKDIERLAKEFDNKDWAFEHEKRIESVVDFENAVVWEAQYDTDKYLTEQEINERSRRHRAISEGGVNIGSSYERKGMHERIDEEYVEKARERILKDEDFRKQYDEKWGEVIRQNEENSKYNEGIKKRNEQTDGKEKVLMTIGELMGKSTDEMYERARRASASAARTKMREQYSERTAAIRKEMEALEVDSKKKQQTYLDRLLKEGKAKRVERVSQKPENFIEERREMNGRYGWFESSPRYNLPEYYSGVVFPDTRSYNHYQKLGIEYLDAYYEKQKEIDRLEAEYREASIAYRMGDAAETFKERQQRAVKNKGTVMPGLNEAVVKVVDDIPRHSYIGNIKEATQQAIDAAKAKYVPNGNPKTLHYNNYGAEFDYSISGRAITILLSSEHQRKSENKGVHLALAEHIDRVISNSIEVEEHPDRLKTNGERDNNNINPDALMHRFYGVARIDGIDYRVMTLMKEENRSNRGNGVHSYEVQKIEVLDEQTPNTPNGVDTLNSELEGYPLAKVIQNVGKTMENGKKLLDASKEADKTTMPKPLNNENRSAAVEAARGVGEQLGGIGVEVVLNGEPTDADKTLTDEQRLAKGWYDPSTGKVYLNASRIESAEDAVRTVLHEKAGHEGLSALLGGQEGVDRWGDFIFKSADKELRRRMVERADAEGYSMADRLRWSKAAQEVFADIAMEGPKTAEEFSLWRKAKHYIIKALKALGIRVRGMVTDEDLRYYVMKTVDALRKGGKKPTLNPSEGEPTLNFSQREGLGSEDVRFNRMPGTPARMEGESDARYFARLREWDKEKQREKWQQEVDNIDSDKILEEYRQQYEQDLQEWRTRYHIAEDATEPVVPDTSSMNMWDATRAMAEYRRQEAVWKTVPKLEDYIARANDEYVARKANIDLILRPGDRAAKLRTISANLQQIRRAMGRQRRYDKKTVDAVVSLAREYLKSGYGDNLGRGDIGRLLSAVRNATGSKDLRPEIDKIVNIMIDSQLRSCESNLWKLANIKEIRRKAVGTGEINVQGKLELRGQRAIQSFRRAIEHRMTEEEIAHRLEELSEKMTNDKEGAVMYEDEYNGLSMALQYVNQIDESRKELEDLKRSRRDAEKDYGNSGRDYNQQKELLEAIDDAMLENRTERIGLYADLYNRLSQTVTKSIEGAKTFIEQEKERVKHIQNIANWDLSGKDASAFHQNDRWKRLNNAAVPRFFLGPTATFEQMLKQFGSRNANGEGYLYRHFVDKYMDSSENEWTGKQDAYERLDEKAREIFGGSIKRFSDLYALDRKMEGVEVTFIDNGEHKTVNLTQGNLLYIYMANKMTDGKMKLRNMGITEGDVEKIKENIDARFVKLGDWIQDVFLQESRKKYNQLHEKLFGAPMEAVDNYFPLKILKDSIYRQVDVGTPDDADNFLPSTTTGAIIRRRRNSLPLDIINADALSMTIEHVDQMEKWAAFAEFNKDVNALLSYKNFRNMVKNMNTVYGAGDILLKNFEDVAKIAAGTYRPKVGRASADKTITNIAKGVTAAKISFRVFTAMKQILSAPAFLHDVDMEYFVKNAANPYGSFKWAIENMPVFEKRWKSRQLGDTRLMDDPTDWKMWKEGIVGRAARWGMTPNGLVDAITCAVGARSIYESRIKKYLKYGYSQEQAHEKALKDAKIGYNLTQQSSESAFVSTIQKDRTVAANALSVFRNSSMSYTRQAIDAMRNLKHRTVKGYKEDAIRFMTGQFMEDGLSEEQALLAAKAEYKRSGLKNLAKLGVTAFILPIAWNLGGAVGYLLLGDDNKLKEKTMTDALIKGLLAGPIEGLAAGSIISDMTGMISSEGFSLSALVNYEMNPLPFFSDLQKTIKHFGNDKWAGIQDLVNIAVQSAAGVNPETVTDIINAAIDYCRGDMTNAKEITLFLTRVLNFPQSGTTDNLYIDELGMNASEAKKLNYDEMAKRYADYKFSKNAPLVGWLYDDAIRNKKKEKLMERFDKKVSEHIARLDDAALARNYDNTNNANYKKLLSKEVAKRTGEEYKILKNINKYEYDKKYILQCQYKDILEDLEIEKIDRSSSQEEIKDIIKWYKDNVRDLKKELLENERPPEEIMNDIRLMRKELLEELRKL